MKTQKQALWLCLLASLPATAAQVTVTSTADSGPGTLRQAIGGAAPGDTINFNLSYPATITLMSGPLNINASVTIGGPGASQLAVSGNNASPVFVVTGGARVVISGLTVENGTGFFGGGILNSGTLTVNDSAISGNTSCCGTQGGGIINGNVLIVNNSTFSGNIAYYDGGGILNQGVATVNRSTFSGNYAGYGAGGAIKNGVGGTLLTIVNSTFSGNGACGPYGPPTYGYLGLGGAIANGGGAYGGGGTVNIINSTFSGNCGRAGGAIYNQTGTLTLKNTLLANSVIQPGSFSPGNCYDASGTLATGGHNLSDDSTCSGFLTAPGDLNHTPAGLDPNGPQNNGGPTQTIAILSTSSALNAIPLTPVNYCTLADGVTPVATDQRGILRPQDAACDIGAFELVQSPAAATQSIIDGVNSLVAQGALSPGNGNSLISKLTAAINQINAGNPAAARGQIGAFVNEVNALLNSGRVEPVQAAAWITAANAVLALLP